MEPLQIESITFSNFKALVNTTLPLGRFTLIVGPNGSGKSTALQAVVFLNRLLPSVDEVSWLQSTGAIQDDEARSVVLQSVKPRSQSTLSAHENNALPQLSVTWKGVESIYHSRLKWQRDSNHPIQHVDGSGNNAPETVEAHIHSFLSGMRVFSFDPTSIAAPVNPLQPVVLSPKGLGLAGVLFRLQTESPEKIQALEAEMNRWLPSFGRIEFGSVPNEGSGVELRIQVAGFSIPASQVSHGTLLALAMLTLAYLPNPPSLIGLEEPDRGIHPRLLRDVRDTLYRLAYPEQFGESRPPVQVIATTQSPYFLDLFREHPEEIVIAEKKGLEAEFVPLSQHGHIEEILADASLGEIWYSGVLGGVPSQP